MFRDPGASSCEERDLPPDGIMPFFPQTSSNVLFPSHVAVVRACPFFDCRVGPERGAGGGSAAIDRRQGLSPDRRSERPDASSRSTPTSRARPASLTKLMTAYLVFRALNDKELTPSQMATVSQKAWRAEGSRMFIDPKKAVSVDELLHGEIVQSGNDAAIALAEVTAGSEEAFVERMNREATRIGMKGTRFVNATGLPAPQQVSTATDLGLIAAAIIRDFPEFYALYSIKEYRYNNITQSNRNRLLWSDPYVDGVKTGFTEARRVLPDRVGEAWSPEAAAVVLGASVRRRARQRSAEAAQLRVPVLRHGPARTRTARRSARCGCGRARVRLGARGLHRRPVL